LARLTVLLLVTMPATPRVEPYIFEVVRAHVAPSPKHPETLHYTGDGVFMVAGKVISRRSQFRYGI
jgi:hypothetical protein